MSMISLTNYNLTTERLKVFRQWLALHKDEFPEAYRKYGLEHDSQD